MYIPFGLKQFPARISYSANMTEIHITEDAVRQILSKFQDPETGRNIVQMEQVHALKVDGPRLSVRLGLTTWSAPVWGETASQLSQLLSSEFPQAEIEVDVVPHERRPEPIGEVGLRAKSVIAVGAGKGGVGKSSVAAYLAYGLLRAGARVGIMDADVYGPSIPHLLGAQGRPQIVDGKIQPVDAAGLTVMSMGLLVPREDAVVWRGPMLHSVLTQLLRDTAWGDLDYLIVDMPPGTGDMAISLASLLPESKAVVVCTPQELALLDAVKAIDMYRKVRLEVLGMIENMSFFVCPNCTARHELFGSGGAKMKAVELGVPLLGELPLSQRLRELGDEGRIAESLDDPQAGPYLKPMGVELVRALTAKNRQKPAAPTLHILH
ncbi:MAG: P-loop NTPase [Planctomycetota bacterium]